MEDSDDKDEEEEEDEEQQEVIVVCVRSIVLSSYNIIKHAEKTKSKILRKRD